MNWLFSLPILQGCYELGYLAQPQRSSCQVFSQDSSNCESFGQGVYKDHSMDRARGFWDPREFDHRLLWPVCSLLLPPCRLSFFLRSWGFGLHWAHFYRIQKKSCSFWLLFSQVMIYLNTQVKNGPLHWMWSLSQGEAGLWKVITVVLLMCSESYNEYFSAVPFFWM